MRVAVLIAGEFRCFEYARPHLAYLDQRDIEVDVYFQTWDQTRLYNGVRVGHRDWDTITGPTKPITEEYVRSVLCRTATVNVCPQPTQKPDIPMIYGWLMGMDMIRNSGKTYDYVFMSRPDLYWSQPPVLVPELIEKFADGRSVGFSLLPRTLNDGLEDAMLFARYDTASRILSQSLVDKIIREGYGGWHNLWHDYIVGDCGFVLTYLPMHSYHNVIARFPASHDHAFRDVVKLWHLWWHQQEKIGMCVIGDYTAYPCTSRNFGFLTQSGVMATNYFTFYERVNHQLPGNFVKTTHDINDTNILQDIDNIPEQKFVQVLEPPETQDYFERTILQWLATFDLITQSKQLVYYVLLIHAEILFQENSIVNMEPIWPLTKESNPYESGISVSTGSTGKYNADIVFGKLEFVKTIINSDLLKSWRWKKSQGDANWQNFWNNWLAKYSPAVLSLPLTEVNYVRVQPPVTADTSYETAQQIAEAWDNYRDKIIPELDKMQATGEVRHLRIPDILKQNLALRDILVIFDLDGVLLESKHMHYQTLNAALAEIDPKYVISHQDHLDKFDGLPTTKKLAMLTAERGLPESQHAVIWRNKQQQTVQWLRNMNYTDERLPNLFRVLKSQNCTIAVASNSIRETVKTALLYMNLMDLVDYFVSNEDVRRPKPHPEMFWRCMTDLNFTPDQTMVVEDSPVGLQAAHHSGAHVVKVGDPYELTVPLLERAAAKLRGIKLP